MLINTENNYIVVDAGLLVVFGTIMHCLKWISLNLKVIILGLISINIGLLCRKEKDEVIQLEIHNHHKHYFPGNHSNHISSPS